MLCGVLGYCTSTLVVGKFDPNRVDVWTRSDEIEGYCFSVTLGLKVCLSIIGSRGTAFNFHDVAYCLETFRAKL